MNNRIPNLLDPSSQREEERFLYSAPAEAGILACIMQRPQFILEAERLIHPEWFQIAIHQHIYRLMSLMATTATQNGWQISFTASAALVVAQHAPPDVMQHFLKQNDGMNRWNEIAAMSTAMSADQFPRYVHAMRDRAARVAIYRKARQMQLSAMDFDTNPDASRVAMQYEAALSTIAFGTTDSRDGKLARLGDYGEDFLYATKMSLMYPHKHLFHLRHPRFEYWMNLMGGGFRRNSMTIICARAKAGKSTLLAELASDLALIPDIQAADGKMVCEAIPTLLLDTEMSGEELLSRELSNIGHIDETMLMSGKWSQNAETANLIEAKHQQLREAPFFYVSIAGRPIEYAISIIRQFVTQHVGTEMLTGPDGRQFLITKPCAVFYDWIKIPSVGDLSRGTQEHQALGDIATKLKDTAKSLRIPIICGAQANKTMVGKSDREQLENQEGTVANSDRLIQFCNTLCILRNPSLDMSEAIEAKWGSVHKDYDGQTIEGSSSWRFNQLLSIVVQRQGKECRTGVPMRLVRGHAHYEEVADEETMKWVIEFYKEKKKKKAESKTAAATIVDATAQQLNATPK